MTWSLVRCFAWMRSTWFLLCVGSACLRFADVISCLRRSCTVVICLRCFSPRNYSPAWFSTASLSPVSRPETRRLCRSKSDVKASCPLQPQESTLHDQCAPRFTIIWPFESQTGVKAFSSDNRRSCWVVRTSCRDAACKAASLVVKVRLSS